MRLLSYVLFFIIVSPITVFAATSVLLVNPPVLYFSKPDTLSIKQVQDILIDAVERSSDSQVIWSIENKKKNIFTVKFVAKNKHTAFLNINYDRKKISIKYKESYNLNYKKLNSQSGTIHRNYLTWVEFLVQKIKFSTEKNSSLSLQEVSPVTHANKKGGQHFVILAQAEPGKRDDDYVLSFTMEKFSASLLKSISNSIVDNNVTIKTVAWNDTIKNLLKESYKKEVSKSLCASHKADKILYANAPRMPGGQGSREITYYLFICSNNRKIKETFLIDRTDYDTFGYEIAFKGSTSDFIEYSNAYK